MYTANKTMFLKQVPLKMAAVSLMLPFGVDTYGEVTEVFDCS